MTYSPAKFGKLVRDKRKSLGLSQDELAHISSIDRSYMGRIERGEVNITLEKVYAIAESLQCNVNVILP